MTDTTAKTDIEYINGLLENALLRLRAVRGRFYPDKNFGSNVRYELPDSEILSEARLAVSELDGVYVKSIEKTDNSVLIFNLVLNDDEREVELQYD